MKRFTYLITILLLAVATIGCEKNNGSEIEQYPMNIDIVSCAIQPDSIVYFDQILPADQGSITLVPNPAVKYKVNEGQRILLQFYDKGEIDNTAKQIEVLNAASILNDTIKDIPLDSINATRNDILRINSAWRTGSYLNFNIQIEFYNRPHKLALYYDLQQAASDTLDVYLRHNNNGDALGYWTTTYASYYIPAFNTYNVLRLHARMADTPQDYITMKIKE